jgi:hypothetical protein
MTTGRNAAFTYDRQSRPWRGSSELRRGAISLWRNSLDPFEPAHGTLEPVSYDAALEFLVDIRAEVERQAPAHGDDVATRPHAAEVAS